MSDQYVLLVEDRKYGNYTPLVTSPNKDVVEDQEKFLNGQGFKTKVEYVPPQRV